MNQPLRASLISLVLLTAIAATLMTVRSDSGTTYAINVQYNKLGWETETTASDVSEFLIQTFGGYENWQIQPVPTTKLTDGLSIVIMDNSTSALDSIVAANLKTEIKKYEDEQKQVEPQSPIYPGLATWYHFGDRLTTASRRFPRGTKLRVIAVNSGKTVDVVVNDYGPQAWTGVELDLNKPAFATLAPLGAGKIQIKYFKI